MLDPTPHLERFGSYERACREFRWQIPECFNIASAILSRHRDAIKRISLVEARPGGLNTYTYGGLHYLSDKFATVLKDRGLRQGDAVALILPQSAASIVAQLGALKVGAVVVPLDPLLDVSAAEFALRDSGARAAVIHNSARERLSAINAVVETVFRVNNFKPVFEDISPDRDFWREVFEASADFASDPTSPESRAFTFYAAASDGELIGVNLSHASLLYQLPAFELCNGLELPEDATFWIPGDWRSVDSLLGSLYPALWYGASVVACEALLSDADVWALIERCEVSHLIASDREIEALRQAASAFTQGALKLRNIIVTDPLPAEACEWATSAGASVNTLFCDKRFGAVAATCKRWYETPQGSPGRAAPGNEIEIVDERGGLLPSNTGGRFAIRRDERSANEVACYEAIQVSQLSTDRFVSETVGFKDEEGNLRLFPG